MLRLQLSPDISVDLPGRFVSCSHNLAKVDEQRFFSTKSVRDPDIRSIKFQQVASMIVPAEAKEQEGYTQALKYSGSEGDRQHPGSHPISEI